MNKISAYTAAKLPSIPSDLAHQTGFNHRKEVPNLIGASSDMEAISNWLNLYADSPHTFRSYHKEIERFYQWALIERQKAFSDLTVDDLMAYWRFMANPQPSSRWCGKAKTPRNHPAWRPFNGPLTDSSRSVALTIIGRCFGYLSDGGYLRGNPVRLMSKAGRSNIDKSAAIERYLSHDTWQFLWGYIEALEDETTKKQQYKERVRFLMALLYLLMPRVSEVASHQMNSFYKYREGWWWRIHGKGNKIRKVPVSGEFIDALKRYRLHRGLPPLPAPNAYEPIIASLTGNRPVSADMIYKIVKDITTQAANVLEQRNPEQALKLRQASTHWMRHTGLTHLADQGLDLRFLKATARHESVETTQRYLHIEEDNWQQAVNTNRL